MKFSMNLGIVIIVRKIGRFRFKSADSNRNRTRPIRFWTDLHGEQDLGENLGQTGLNQPICLILHQFQTELLDLD